jgi:hypothetical protein
VKSAREKKTMFGTDHSSFILLKNVQFPTKNWSDYPKFSLNVANGFTFLADSHLMRVFTFYLITWGNTNQLDLSLLF